MRPRSLALVPLLALLALPGLAAERYLIDPAHSSIRFTVPYTLMVLGEVQGELGDFVAEALYDADDLTASRVRVVIETDSIDTGFGPRDEHLKSAEFFAAADHPRIVFRSTAVTRSGGELLVSGRLRLAGVEREVEIPFTLAESDDALFVSGTTRLRRADFGIGDEGPLASDSYVVGERVTIHLALLLRRIPTAAQGRPAVLELAGWAGRYRAEDRLLAARVELYDDLLGVQLTAQPLTPLFALGGGRFGIAGAGDVELRFAEAGGGPAELVIDRGELGTVRLRRVPGTP